MTKAKVLGTCRSSKSRTDKKEVEMLVGNASFFRSSSYLLESSKFCKPKLKEMGYDDLVTFEMTMKSGRRYITHITKSISLSVLPDAASSDSYPTALSYPEKTEQCAQAVDMIVGEIIFNALDNQLSGVTFLPKCRAAVKSLSQLISEKGRNWRDWAGSPLWTTFANAFHDACLESSGLKDERIFFRGYEHPVFGRSDYRATPIKKVVEKIEEHFSDDPTSALLREEKVESWIEVEEEKLELDDLDGYIKIGDIFIDQTDYKILSALLDVPMANGLFVGPSGYGKTSVPMALAEEKGLNWVRVNCSAVRDPEEWFGYREAVDGSTVFVENEMAQKMREGNCVILLDEFNRVEPWITNALLPLMDKGKTTVHNQTFERGENVTFIATINSGVRFTGTFTLDAALANRMDAVFRVQQLPFPVESKLVVERTGLDLSVAKDIVEVVRKIRKEVEKEDEDVDVSTRSSLKIGKLVAAGVSLKEALIYTILNVVPGDSPTLKNLIDIINIL